MIEQDFIDVDLDVVNATNRLPQDEVNTFFYLRINEEYEHNMLISKGKTFSLIAGFAALMEDDEKFRDVLLDSVMIWLSHHEDELKMFRKKLKQINK